MPAPTPRLLARALAAATDGAPPVLPRSLDRCQEWWARRPPRQRAALAATAALLLAVRLVASAAPDAVTVLVATADLPAGHVLAASDLRTQHRPRGDAPVAPHPGDPTLATGRVLDQAVPAGAVLTNLHVREGSPAQRAPEGHVAFALPIGELPDLGAGTVVDLFGGEGVQVPGAVVLGIDGSTTWVSVPRELAGALARAAAWGPLRVAVVPRPPRA